ncbi:MAG: alpha-amylase family glycosyl hydrolase [Actinobacteria bacterium]|nr:alpha-amylase family glycosyl hydrolase [Actinomycetota bacterium]MCZ6738429.1 alpha-amylase family glycosyl hydrolase [Actinomycetota bacterium]
MSLSDSDSDGFGDLTGIISKLDYLSDTLEVDALWLSPLYRSPIRDWGYDISDHTESIRSLAMSRRPNGSSKRPTRRGLRVIVGYVMNHTSDEHPWFIESRSSRDFSN